MVNTVVAQADGDRPEQADHHDGPCTVKDCQRCRAERAEARIAELEARVRRCHAILQDIVSRSDPSVYGEAMKELGGEFCPGACTTACDSRIAELEAENASLKAKLAIPVKIVETSPGVFEGMGQRWPKA